MNTRAVRHASTLPVLALSLFLTVPAGAQTLGELDNLIFEPVPLSADHAASRDEEAPLHALAPHAFTAAPPPSRLQPAALSPPLAASGAAARPPLITDRNAVEVYEAVIDEMVMEDGPYTPELAQEL